MSAEHQTRAPVLDLRQRLEQTRGGDNGTEPVSPELALVDPELARNARARLPDPSERQRPAAAPASWEAERPRASRVVRALRVAAAVVLAGTLALPAVTALTRDSSTQSTSSPRGDGPGSPVRGEVRSALRATAAPARPTPARPRAAAARRERPAARRRAATAPRPAARTFVWVPVRGADGYEVQFFRGARRVLLTRTQRPRLVVPAARGRGTARRPSLRPGAYRWYVWPLFRTRTGLRRGDAVVQARLVVSR
jgi:hypothetical protein